MIFIIIWKNWICFCVIPMSPSLPRTSSSTLAFVRELTLWSLMKNSDFKSPAKHFPVGCVSVPAMSTRCVKQPTVPRTPTQQRSAHLSRMRKQLRLTNAKLQNIRIVRPSHDDSDEQDRDPVQNSLAAPLDTPRSRRCHGPGADPSRCAFASCSCPRLP